MTPQPVSLAEFHSQ